MTNYIQVLGEFFPATQATVAGGLDPTIYTNISWISASIPQSTLDALANYVPSAVTSTSGLTLPQANASSASVYFEGLNLTGSTIAIGTPVYITGTDATSGLPTIAPSDASNSTKMPCDGVASISIATSNVGPIVQSGIISPYPTTGMIEGTNLYVVAGGGLTTTVPTGSTIVQLIGEVMSVGASGSIKVGIADIQNDKFVKNSATDTTASYLSSKLTAGAGITFTTNNAGANESITIASSVVQTNQAVVEVYTSATNTTSGTSSTYTTIAFSSSSIVNTPASLNWVSASGANVTALVAGPYLVTYNIPFATNANSRTLSARVVISGGTTAISGSQSTDVIVANEGPSLNATFVVSLTAGQYLSLQVASTHASDTVSIGANMGVVQLIGAIGPAGSQGIQGLTGIQGPTGAQGIQGLSGSGSTLNVYNQGSLITGSPFSSLNFTGNAVVTSSLTAGQANVAIATSIPLATFDYFAPHFDSPNTSDWYLNSLAPLITDPSNSGLLVRQFDSVTNMGVGFMTFIPSGASNINLTIVGRAQTAYSGDVVQFTLAARQLNNGTVLGTWAIAINMSGFGLFYGANNQFLTFSSALASTTGLTAGGLYQFELYRQNTVGSGTNSPAQYLLSALQVVFT